MNSPPRPLRSSGICSGMYAPSFVTGHLIDAVRLAGITPTGAVLLLACC